MPPLMHHHMNSHLKVQCEKSWWFQRQMCTFCLLLCWLRHTTSNENFQFRTSIAWEVLRFSLKMRNVNFNSLFSWMLQMTRKKLYRWGGKFNFLRMTKRKAIERRILRRFFPSLTARLRFSPPLISFDVKRFFESRQCPQKWLQSKRP